MLISVVIPFRNRATFLPRTLQSVLQQTYRPIELLLVDNGSDDGSAKICQDFASSYSAADFTVKLLNHPAGGACSARNAGLAKAQAEYLYFFDSDDEMSANFLTHVVEVLRQRPQTDMITAPTRMVFPDGRERVRKVYRTASVRDHILTSMLSTQSYVVRRHFLEKAGRWNEALPKWNDWELGVRLLQHKPRIMWLSNSYHRIYQHADSLTGTSLSATYAAIRPALQAVRSLVDGYPDQLVAFAAREVILAAELNRAGMEEEAQELRAEALAVRPSLKWIYRYANCGGKGAWWLCRTFIR